MRASVLLWAPILLGASCGSTTTFSAPCPIQPTKWTLGSGSSKVELDPENYPPAPRASQSSIDIELNSLYMRRKIKDELEKPPADNPTPDSGLFVNDVALSEQGAGVQKLNVLTVQITPWLRGASGNPASLQRSYRLTLKIVPYLVTPSTVQDVQKRQAFLGGADSGAVVKFELVDLYSLVNQESVSCSSANYDLIDSHVLSGLYDALATTRPLVFPAAQVTDMANTMLGATTSIVGMNVGSDTDLKIGLLLDQGTPTTFDSQTFFMHFPQDDWGIRLDTAFVTAAITAAVRAAATAADPAATINSVTTSFVSGGIGIVAKGTLNKCGGIGVTVNANITPLVRKRSDGQSILVTPSTQTESNTANLLQGACFYLDQFFASFAHPLGNATATVNGSGVCGFAMGDPVEFDAGPGDHFYATAVSTDDLFEVAGRSTFIDQQIGARPAVPACP